MDEAIKILRRELRAFGRKGLVALRDDILSGKVSAERLPTRGTWRGCPLSYREGGRGSATKDSVGDVANAFTEAWDGIGCDYLDESVVVQEVERELIRRASRVQVRTQHHAVRRGNG